MTQAGPLAIPNPSTSAKAQRGLDLSQPFAPTGRAF